MLLLMLCLLGCVGRLEVVLSATSLARFGVKSARGSVSNALAQTVLTWRVAAVGPFFAPFMTTFQISSKGGSSSHGIDIRGESHLTMDEGSSNRINRLSNLIISPGL